VHDLWLGKVLDRYVTTIPLNGFTGDRAALTLNLEGTRVLNHADAISHALTLYRVSATKLTALFYCAVIVMLMWRYGINRALRIILPSLAGTLASIAALGLFGIPLNVFSVFALMVLLGISIDYAIFFAEDGHNSPTTTYAVLLSAVTTITSFGALVCSSTPALQSFGIVLSVGVLFSALLAPIAQSGASRR
jgi:predicted exporter